MQHANRYALLRHRGLPTKEVNATYEESVKHFPPPNLLVELDAAGYQLAVRAYQTGEYWHWVGPDGVRASYDFLTLPAALRGWEQVNKYPKLTGVGKATEGMATTSMVIESIGHIMAAGHRLAAKDSVPEHVTIPLDAKVSPVSSPDGRVAGVWVDAKVYVSLSG